MSNKSHSNFTVVVAVILLLLAPLLIPLKAATRQRGLRALTLSHGLSDLLVNVIYKDGSGFVWFGTESSLDRFDGNNIIRFPIDGDASRSRRVLAITELKDGRIFVGTSQGLYELEKGGAKLNRLFKDKIDSNVTSFAHGDNNILYIGTHNGLYIYNTSTGKLTQRLLIKDRLSHENEIIGLKYEQDGHLHILTPNKIWCLNVKNDKLVSYNLPCKNRATRICEIGEILYIGTEGDGVISFNTGTDTFGNSFKPGNGVVTSLSATDTKNLMVGTDGEGIYFYDPKEGKEIHHLTTSPDSRRQLRANSVYSTLSDAGQLWIGYYQGGVDYTPLELDILSLYKEPSREGVSDLSVRDFNWDGKDLFLFGTPEGLILVDTSTQAMRTFEKPLIDSNVIFSIEFLNGLFYIGTFHGGMYTLNPTTGAIAHFGPEDLREASVFKMLKDSKGNLWVASSQGLYIFEGGNAGKYQHYTSANSQLPAGNVYDIFFDSSGRGWICTENGMAVWNGTHIQTSGFPANFINHMKIRTVYEDTDGNLYFAPDRGEIWKSDLSLQEFGPLKIGAPGRFSQFTSIIEDKNGMLWIGTDKGLVRYNRKNGKYSIINNVEGNMDPVFTLATPLRDKEDFLWMGSTSGLMKIDVAKFEELEKKLKTYKLHFTHFSTNGHPIADRYRENGKLPEITLNGDESNITINVSDFSLRYMEHVELEYKLDGVDEDWKWTTGNLPIEYRDLHPGTYILKVREAGNPDSEIELKIIKKGNIPWAWIILIIVISIMGGGFWLYSLKRGRQSVERIADQTNPQNTSETSEDKKDSRGKKHAAYSTTRLSEEECKRLLRKLENVMKNEKPYTNQDLKSKDLATMIGTSAHALSFLFNQYLHKSYYDYVNEYRVEEFKRLVNDIDISKYTLTTLAERCGFSSRASFFRHFKAITGQTPAEYLRN